MDRDSFIIHVYCLVVERYGEIVATQRLRHGGFAPELSDEEVMTMEICGEFFKLGKKSAAYRRGGLVVKLTGRESQLAVAVISLFI